MQHIPCIDRWRMRLAGSSNNPNGLDRTLLGRVADLRQLSLMLGLILIPSDDSLRTAAQKEGYSGECL